MRFSHLHYQLTNKLLKNRDSSFSRPIIYLSVIGITLGVMIMLLAVGITMGYKSQIRQKVTNIGGHIRISNYDFNYSYEPVPIDKGDIEKLKLDTLSGVANISYYTTKVGVVKTEEQVEGIVLKGVDSPFFQSGFRQNIIDGEIIQYSTTMNRNEIVISKKMSDKLQIKIGDKLRTYFVQDPPKYRSYEVVGIYETGLPEYDELFAFVDIKQVQKLCDWSENQIGGAEILLSDFNNVDKMTENINQQLDYHTKAESIKEIYPQIFEWIALFDMNVVVLLAITIFVCIITILSTFFIIVLEQIRTIGILKAIGMKNRDISTIFILIATKIIVISLFIGNSITLILTFLQQKFHFIKLDADTYFIPYVPVSLSLTHILLLNIGVLIITLLSLLIPSKVIATHISPVSAIRFE